jgi:DNA-binding GntR family transcriptional regulator
MNQTHTMLVSKSPAPVRNQAIQNLRKAIVDGRFKPGQRLIERELCQLMGVSRTSVREALRHLEADGLIKVIPNRGTIVAVITVAEAREIYQIREVMESLAIRLFAEHAKSSQVATLVHAVEILEKLCLKGEIKNIINAKNDFYNIILEGCGNKLAHSFIKSLLIRISFLRSLSLTRPGRPMESLQEIKLIVRAIERRDPCAAETASRIHVKKAESNALKVLQLRDEGP